MPRVGKQSQFLGDLASSGQLEHDEVLEIKIVQGVLHVLMAPANEAQPPIPVKKAKKQSHGIDIEPGPPSYAT